MVKTTINFTNSLVFDRKFARQIILAFGYKIDKESYITKNGKRILSISKNPIRLSEFGGIIRIKGKIYFVRWRFQDLILLNELIK
jgi:hypothetical protein